MVNKDGFLFSNFFCHFLIDLTPPTIKCPESVLADTDVGLPYKEISFLQPIVIDNSISGSDDIIVTQDPPNIKSPYKFPIGSTTVTFTASDQASNSHSCSFSVEIQGESKSLLLKIYIRKLFLKVQKVFKISLMIICSMKNVF